MIAVRQRVSTATPPDWREGLPVLRAPGLRLRELAAADAPRLLAIARDPAVFRYTWPPPPGVAAVERFIRWTHEERASGRYFGYAVLREGEAEIDGLFEMRRLQPDFFRGEIGFFLAPDVHGAGVFAPAARAVIDFAFAQVGVHRVEARVAVDNERSHAALAKLGAEQEGVLHDAFLRDGRYVDQVMWAVRRQRWQRPGAQSS